MYHALVSEKWINWFKNLNYTHVDRLIFEYIETLYNTVRIHSHCGYLFPNKYEKQYPKSIDRNAIKMAS